MSHTLLAESTGLPTAAQTNPRRQLGAAMIGNVLEYYDFVVYAFLATYIAKKFFQGDEVVALLSSFAAFGVGFLARPLGGAIIGRVADKMGRKVALQLTIFLMAVGTVGIGLLPTYATIGIAAPILLVALRLTQGVAAGGEWGSATTLVIESAAPGKRGFYGSLGQASIAASSLVSSIVVGAVAATMSPAQMDEWGWRIPFLLGGLLLPVGLYMRRNLQETAAFEAAKEDKSSSVPPGAALGLMGRASGIAIIWCVSYYIMLSYMPTFLVKHAGLSQQNALLSNSIALAVLVAATPVFGWVSDRVGRRPLMLLCCAGFALLTYPLFSVIVGGASFATILMIQILFNLLISAFNGGAPAAICEIFPTKSRTMLLSIGYSCTVAVFGGFAPFLATWLIATTGSPLSPTYYVIAAAIVSGLVVYRLKETAYDKLK